MSLPYQAMLNPEPEEVRRLLREKMAVGVRFPSLRWSGLESGLYVLRKRHYDIGSLHTKHRPRVRHALQCFEVRNAEKAELLDQGWALNLSTMARQCRYDPEFGDRRRWGRFVEAAFQCPEVSFPAAFSGRRMAAYMTTCREEKWLHILHQMSRQDDLPNFPNHLLTFAVTKEAASDASIEAVCYGYVPLFAADGLHEYKLRFGYEMVPHRSAIQLHPALNVVLNQSAARAAVRAWRAVCDTRTSNLRRSKPFWKARGHLGRLSVHDDFSPCCFQLNSIPRFALPFTPGDFAAATTGDFRARPATGRIWTAR